VFELDDILNQIEQAFSNKKKSDFFILLSDDLTEKNVKNFFKIIKLTLNI